VNIGPNVEAASFEFSNNLWYAHDDPARSAPMLPAAETNGLSGADPHLKDPLHYDFELGPTSLALSQGRFLAEVTVDAKGHPYRRPPSMGAYEHIGADTDRDGMPDLWEIDHELDPDNPADAMWDSDRDGMINRNEFVAGTLPWDASSVLKLGGVTRQAGGWRAALQTGRDRTYAIEASVDPASASPWVETDWFAGDGTQHHVSLPDSGLVGMQLFRVRAMLGPISP
jgi:hypothetical protein